MRKLLKKFGFIHKDELREILDEKRRIRFRNQVDESLRKDKSDFYKGLCFGEFVELKRQVETLDKYFKL